MGKILQNSPIERHIICVCLKKNRERKIFRIMLQSNSVIEITYY